MSKKIAKVTLKILGGIILLLVLLLLLLRLPYVQTKIAHFATKKLSKQLNTKVSIDKVAMNFIDNASVKGIYIEDLNQDTLLYAREISVGIAFFKLLRKTIEIDKASLQHGVIRVSENKDSVYNFQFVIDAFASEDTTTTTSENPFLIDLDHVSLQDISVKADLLASDNLLYFKDLDTRISKFDLVNGAIVVDRINLDGLIVESRTEPVVASALESVSEDEESEALMGFPLEANPFDLEFGKVSINDAHISAKEKGYQPTPNFDPRYIDLKNLQVDLRNVKVDDKRLNGSISELRFNLNDQFSVNEFATEIMFSEQGASLKELMVKLPNSRAEANFETRYNNFNELTNLGAKTGISINIPLLDLSIADLSYFVSSDVLGTFQKEVLHANINASGTLANLDLKSLHLEIGNTLVDAKGRMRNLHNPDSIGIRNFSINGKADYEEYAVFLPNDTLKRQLKEIGDIKLKAKADGNLNALTVSNLEIYTESLAEAKLSGTMKQLTDPDKLSFDVVIHHITSGYQDAAIFVDSLPDMIKKFDTISYVGTARGDLQNITLDGGFKTSLGDLTTDLSVQFNSEYSDAKYKGAIELQNFDLGSLLENDSLGRISIDAKFDGSGLDPDSIKTQIDANVASFEFNGYEYENINVDGFIDGLEFIGKVNVSDENVKMRFDGLVDMNDSIPIMNFSLVLDTLNLEKLNLSDSMFQVQLEINADIAGLNPDDADGKIVISNVNLRKEKKEWRTDSITLVASRKDNEKGLYLNGDFISVAVEGDYKVSLLPDAILDFLDQYFPLKTFLGQTVQVDSILNSKEQKIVRNDVVSAEIAIYDVEELVQFFNFPLEQLDTLTLDFTLDLPNNLTEFEFLAPVVLYDGYYIENIRAIANNNPDLIKSSLTIDSLSFSESVHLAGLNLDMIFREQTAMIQALVRNQKNEKSLGFSTRITSQDATEFNIDFIKDFVLNNQKWNLTQESSIIVDETGFIIPSINLNNGSEAFNLSGSSQKINLQFTDFNLNNFIEIVGIDSLDVKGQMNGDLELGLDDETPISGDLLINGIKFNEFDIGDLELDATKEGQDVTALISLKGEEVNLEGDMEYDLSSSYMFGKVLIEKLNLEPFAPLVNAYGRDLKGAMQGYIAVEGQLTDPNITGALYFQEVEAYIVDLATVYKIKEGKINISDGLIKPTATLEDKAGRLSYLKGDITHDFFDDIAFDLDFDADQFMFLDSKQSKREYFYGTFVAKVRADITGTPERPVIDADITALQETDLTIQLLSSAAALTQENYMIFYDGSEINSEEAIDSISQKVYEANNSIELNLTLHASDNALFHVVVDPVTGDKLDIRGNTDLIVRIPSYGNISITGDYIVSEGRYRVSYENTIRRIFDLDAGSKIVFQGDPYNARLDMRALYKTEASTYALLQSTGNNIDESGSLRTEVNVVLSVEGTLIKPSLSFDIQVPEITSSPVGNAITTALSQLRQNETQLLEQVGSIILFNSFIGGSSGGNISSVGTSTAVNSVGNLINGQLNKLASKASGFEIDFNIDQYKDVTKEGNANVTEFGLGLQQKLFNDRLIISAGGNANLETGQTTSNPETGQSRSNNFSSFAGDFVIQYLLTDSGKLRVKVFQKSDYNAIDNDNYWKTGAGLTYKTKFGQIKPKK